MVAESEYGQPPECKSDDQDGRISIAIGSSMNSDRKIDIALAQRISEKEEDSVVSVIIELYEEAEQRGPPLGIHKARALAERSQEPLMRSLRVMRAEDVTQHWIRRSDLLNR